MKLSGLGAACLSMDQLYQLALSVGFPPGFTPNQGNAGTMAAIAMRESSGCPNATNIRAPGTNGPTDPGEDSYGLWQINVDANPQFNPNQLTDPTYNAQAAYQLWGGNDANLGIAWYIGKGGQNDASYLANLVAVQAAVGIGSGAALPDLIGAGGVSGAGTGDGTGDSSLFGLDFTDPTTLAITLGAGAVLVLLLFRD